MFYSNDDSVMQSQYNNKLKLLLHNQDFVNAIFREEYYQSPMDSQYHRELRGVLYHHFRRWDLVDLVTPSPFPIVRAEQKMVLDTESVFHIGLDEGPCYRLDELYSFTPGGQLDSERNNTSFNMYYHFVKSSDNTDLLVNTAQPSSLIKIQEALMEWGFDCDNYTPLFQLSLSRMVNVLDDIDKYYQQQQLKYVYRKYIDTIEERKARCFRIFFQFGESMLLEISMASLIDVERENSASVIKYCPKILH